MTKPASRRRLTTLTNTLIVAAGYFFSRILGLAREVIISAQFGTTAQLDAFKATFGIVDMIYLVVAGGALGTAFIPVFAGMLGARREEDAWQLASTMLNLALAGLVAACLLVGLLAEPIVALTVGSGFDDATRALTVDLLRWMLIQPVLLGVGGLVKSVLESSDRFSIPALGANLYNIGIILGALLAPWLGVWGLVLGVNAGALVFLAVQIPALIEVGARYRYGGWWRTPGVTQVFRMLGPRLFGQAVWQINLIAVASFASLVGPGAVSANSLATQLMLLPHGLLALSVGTVLFPQLARLHAAGDQVAFRAQALGALRMVFFLSIPASVILGALAQPITRLLYERAAFGPDSTLPTTQALTAYMIGLAAFTASEIMVRSFYAMQDTRTPVVIACIAVASNIGLGYLLLRMGVGLAGLALAFSIANTIEAGLLLVALAHRVGGLGRGFGRAVGNMVLAGLTCLIALEWLQHGSGAQEPFTTAGAHYQWPGDFLVLALWVTILALVGLGVYGGLAVALRIPEVQALSRFRRSLSATQQLPPAD